MDIKCINYGEKHASYNKQCSEYDIQHIRVSRNVSLFEAREIHQQTHGETVKDYAGTVKVQAQRTSICTQTDVSWVWSEPVMRRQHPVVSATNKQVPSVPRSVGTTTRVADVNKTMAPISHHLRGRVNKPANPLRQSNRFHLFMSLLHSDV